MEEHTDPYRDLIALQAECAKLREENARLRKQLADRVKASFDSHSLDTSSDNSVLTNSFEPTKENATPGVQASVTNASAPNAKIALFRKLFRGRDDVHAVRWTGRNGRSGYSPAAARDAMSRFKSSDKKNRKYFPLTDEVIRDHLLGKHTVGIYPLLLDETCWFLAVDFDKQAWQTDATAFMKTCRDLGLPAVLERSRSGNGGHIWLFFDTPLSAAIARKLGCYLLTTTMDKRYAIGLDSYDRLFPNQDTMPKGGFGNLIALPLQRGPRELGNSVFIDNDLEPFADQWTFLSTIKKINANEVDAILNRISNSGAIMGVRTSTIDPDSIDAPWMFTDPSGKADTLISGPLPDTVRLLRSNLIYIEKRKLPSSFLNRLVRLAAFQNSEFYRAQAMRLSTFGKPRVISCAEEFQQHVALPRGLLDDALNLFEAHRIKAEIEDQVFNGNEIAVEFRGKLNKLQKDANAKTGKRIVSTAAYLDKLMEIVRAYPLEVEDADDIDRPEANVDLSGFEPKIILSESFAFAES